MLRSARPIRLAQAATSRRVFWGRGSSDPPRPLAPPELVDAWMADSTLIDPGLPVWRRAELWLTLRMLHGLDLEDFLRGASGAYPVVLRAMYNRDWPVLEPLVSEQCLDAMQATMEDMARNAQRVDLAGDESDFQMISCRLSRAQILQSDSETPAGSCLLHVSYEVQERYTILDCHSEQPLPPFDGSAREQKSTWVFSGVVTPPIGEEASGKGEGEDGGGGGGARDEVEHGWRLHSVV